MKRNAILIIGFVLCGVVFGLGQRICVQKARAFAANQEYTPAQIENATRQQILGATGLTDPNEILDYTRHWSGIKIMLLNDTLERQTQDRLILLKQQLNAAYPDAVGVRHSIRQRHCTAVTAVALWGG